MPNKPRRIKLTQGSISRLKPSADGAATTWWDTAMPGFGLRISPLGRKTWVAQYRIHGTGKDVIVNVLTPRASTILGPLNRNSGNARHSLCAMVSYIKIALFRTLTCPI